MSKYLDELIDAMETQRNEKLAGPMSAYMRNQFRYLGIKSPELSNITQAFYKKWGLPQIAELEQILLELWNLPEREFQYAAVGMLSRMVKKLPPDFITTIETLITQKSWWDTVDSLATNIVGEHFSRYPDVNGTTLPIWRMSDNIWLRRTSILYQLNYGARTDFALLMDAINENLGSKEFFINKAIGWSLRQYSKIAPDEVIEFVNKTQLNPLSKREALKWLERRKLNG